MHTSFGVGEKPESKNYAKSGFYKNTKGKITFVLEKDQEYRISEIVCDGAKTKPKPGAVVKTLPSKTYVYFKRVQ